MVLNVKETTSQKHARFGRRPGARFPISQVSEATQRVFQLVDQAREEGKAQGLECDALIKFMFARSWGNCSCETTVKIGKYSEQINTVQTNTAQTNSEFPPIIKYVTIDTSMYM